jgi:hypothetical protein
MSSLKFARISGNGAGTFISLLAEGEKAKQLLQKQAEEKRREAEALQRQADGMDSSLSGKIWDQIVRMPPEEVKRLLGEEYLLVVGESYPERLILNSKDRMLVLDIRDASVDGEAVLLHLVQRLSVTYLGHARWRSEENVTYREL